MSRTITIRNVPDDVAEALLARARRDGRSLQSFMLGVMCREASTADIGEVLRSVREEARRDGASVSTAEVLAILDEERDG